MDGRLLWRRVRVVLMETQVHVNYVLMAFIIKGTSSHTQRFVDMAQKDDKDCYSLSV